jgi:hypothetical protein
VFFRGIVSLDNKTFVNEIQNECLKESVAHDVELLSTTALDRLDDPTMHDLAKAWQSADESTKITFQKLMYLSSKHSIAATLHLIDTQYTMKVNPDHLVVGELLDLFLKQSAINETVK